MNPVVLFAGSVVMVLFSFDGSPWPPEGAVGVGLLWLALSVSVKACGQHG